MIIIDLNQIFISSIIASGAVNNPDKDMFRYYILNSVKSHKKKNQVQYGKDVILAVDGNERGWRRGIFPNYKYERRMKRKDSDQDWSTIFKYYQEILQEIKQYVPVTLIQHPNCEADDIISVLARKYSKEEKKVLIISGDKDFIQLHNEYTRQYAPVSKQWVTHPNPEWYKKEHIIKGDAGDGIPNFYTDDDFFKEKFDKGIKGRQKSIYKKKLDEWCKLPSDAFCDTDETMMYYERNKRLIDLEMIPMKYQNAILEQYENYKKSKGDKLWIYLSSHGNTNLLNDLNNFF